MLDDEFNQIKAALNVQEDNLSKRPRIDMAGTSQNNRGDETKYLVSGKSFSLNSSNDFADDNLFMNVARSGKRSRKYWS